MNRGGLPSCNEYAPVNFSFNLSIQRFPKNTPQIFPFFYIQNFLFLQKFQLTSRVCSDIFSDIFDFSRSPITYFSANEIDKEA